MLKKKECDYGLELAYKCFLCTSNFFYTGFNNQMQKHLKEVHGIENPKEFVELDEE